MQIDRNLHPPTNSTSGTLVGRVWRPELAGPSVVAIRQDGVFDISRSFADHARSVRIARSGRGRRGRACATASAISATSWRTRPRTQRDPNKPWLLAPIDLQAVKAAGVTFAISLLERVIEEQARGAPERAAQARAEVESALGGTVERLKPGSPQAMELKKLLQAKGLWSQYLEVGIGPDAEIFTKSPGDGGGRHRHVDRRARSRRPGTIRSPRSWWSRPRRAGSSARRSATT